MQSLESIFTLTWQASVRACVLIVVVLVVQALAGKRFPAQFRYALGLLVLLRLIVPVTPASGWNILSFARRPQPAVAAPILPATSHSRTGFVSSSLQTRQARSGTSHLSLNQWAALLWSGGGVAFLMALLRRHWKFARWVARLPSASDSRLIELVHKCKGEVGLRRRIKIAIVSRGNSAAVFGFIRPCLLLPEDMLSSLDSHEARLVILHELFHIRRLDVLVNWIRGFALALHWFNPLAWIAMRRLRSDQELACDASVLGLIEQAERGAYGRTLLKHLRDFPAARLAAGLVPFITFRHNIKRRIIMITEFKRTGGLASGLFVLLLLILGGLTLTRAADDAKPLVTNATARSSFQNTLTPIAGRNPPGTSSFAHSGASFATGLTPSVEDSRLTPDPKSREDYGTEYVKESVLLEQLNTMQNSDHSHFVQALSTTTSDPILNSLVEQEMAQETKLAGLRMNFGPEMPEIRGQAAMIEDLKKKIDQRAEGIMAGMQVQIASLKAAANDAAGHPFTQSYMLTHQLEDWDHRRVTAEADYLEYSNILFNLGKLPENELGGALATAYAHQVDPELINLSDRLQSAKAKMVEAENNYGKDTAPFQIAKKQLEDAKIAYQNQIDAVMEGIETRVKEDKGFLQIIQQKEDEIHNAIVSEAQKNRP